TRLFAKLGYSSLHKYLIHELGYSESAAFRRVQALKLVREVPESKEMIESGELTLTNIASVQTMLKGHDSEIKKQAINKVKKKTSSEAQDLLFKMVPDKEKKPRDIKKKVSSTHTRLSVTLSSTVMDKMEKVKAMTKKYHNEELINYLLDLAIEQKEKANNKKARKSKGSTNPRVITAKVKREVALRAKGVCEDRKSVV